MGDGSRPHVQDTKQSVMSILFTYKNKTTPVVKIQLKSIHSMSEQIFIVSKLLKK